MQQLCGCAQLGACVVVRTHPFPAAEAQPQQEVPVELLGGRSSLRQGVFDDSLPGQRALPEDGELAVSLGQLAAVEETEEESQRRNIDSVAH